MPCSRHALTSCREATRHAACCLGQVTFAANHHKVERAGEDGITRTVIIRDAQEAPRKQHSPGDRAARSASKVVHEKATKQAKRAVQLFEFQRQEPPSKRRLTEARYRAERAVADRAALKRNLAQPALR